MWQFWSTRELQEEIGEDRLDFLSHLLSEVDEHGRGFSFQTNKNMLAKLVSSLQDHTYFRKKSNLEYCLYRLPDVVLKDFLGKISYEENHEVADYHKLAKFILASDVAYRLMIDHFDIDKRFIAEAGNKKPSFFDAVGPSADSPKCVSKCYKTLKGYQTNCLQEISKVLAPPQARALLQMPTGSGKTRTAFEFITQHLKEEKSPQVVWLANTRELCEQAIQCFEDLWDHVGDKKIRVNRLWGSYSAEAVKSLKEGACASLTVMGLQSAWEFLRKDEQTFRSCFRHLTLIVLDEAHIAVAHTYSTIVRELINVSMAKMIGLTATPGRSIEKQTSELSDIFFGRMVALSDPNTARSNAIAYLREEGVMSTVRYEILPSDVDFKLTESQISKIEKTKDLPPAVLKELGKNIYRSISIIKAIRSHLDANAKVILFAPSVENSFLLNAALVFLGYSSVHLDGETPAAARDSIISDFEKSKYQIICNYSVLSTGFDSPKIDVVCIARPTFSAVLYSQMIGRGLRGYSVGGTKSCTILEVRDNFEGLGTQDMLYTMFDEYWN